LSPVFKKFLTALKVTPEDVVIGITMPNVLSLPFHVGLEIEQIHKKTNTKQHWKGEWEVPELCDPS